MKIRGLIFLPLAIAGLMILPPLATAQSGDNPRAPSSTTDAPSPAKTNPEPVVVTYTRPTERTKLRNYAFDMFGPYPIASAAVTAGIGQTNNAPPEWKQGAEGYGKRFGSSFAISAINTTTRYGLAAAFREDTLYYRCECKGAFPRLGHAVISTITARRGDDGHRVLSFPAIVAPYAGNMAAVYGWYPSRFSAMDGFRMGNYSVLAAVGGNIAREFIFRGPHAWFSRKHTGGQTGTSTSSSRH
ncbi:MAG: hypothetical protein LAP21_05140 [Acidobacteriia bacterium]|nr:hypothetical protein [Terriglobia bacterium]